MNQIFIIEHLDKELYEWCLIEYKSISKSIGKDRVWFTNIKKKDLKKLSKYGKVSNESVKSMNLKNSCVLDPNAKEILSSKVSRKFQYFIFGGILGDNPPKKRTEEELTPFVKNAKALNIGKEQFSTDNAVYVVDQIIKGYSLEEIKFQDELEIKIDKIQSTILPYRYPLINNKPRISSELIKFIKKRDSLH